MVMNKKTKKDANKICVFFNSKKLRGVDKILDYFFKMVQTLKAEAEFGLVTRSDPVRISTTSRKSLRHLPVHTPTGGNSKRPCAPRCPAPRTFATPLRKRTSRPPSSSATGASGATSRPTRPTGPRHGYAFGPAIPTSSAHSRAREIPCNTIVALRHTNPERGFCPVHCFV